MKTWKLALVLAATTVAMTLPACAFTKKVKEPAPAETVLDPVVVKPVETPAPTVPAARIALSWENTTEPHPERASWSDVVIAGMTEYKSTFDKAVDVTEFCPKYKSLAHELQLKALGEFSVALAYYESGYKPSTNSVDVGTKGDKGSWSVGLYQLSANDNSAKKFNMTFEKLKDPHLNIMVYVEQMQKQVSMRKKFFLENKDSMRYWAVALKGNKYSQIPGIIARVKKNAPACVQ